MVASAFELFRIGIGPSSSHTVGPMRAARRFLEECKDAGMFGAIERVRVELFGSLALTGVGHGTDRALLLGLSGLLPETVDTDAIPRIVGEIAASGRLRLLGGRPVGFDKTTDLIFRKKDVMPGHPNGMRFTAFDAGGDAITSRDYYSIGGGFVLAEGETATDPSNDARRPYDFKSAAELLELANRDNLTIAELAFANEAALRTPDEIREGLDEIWAAMQGSIERGLATDGELPGPFRVKRRAPGLHRRLLAAQGVQATSARIDQMDWVTAYAIAVNEENAAGGRVVTAPTNGAAGIIPSVLAYARRFHPAFETRHAHEFLLTAACIGALYKRNASISGAEVGCQGEVGVACSMAAAGLAAALGGMNAQIENAAEIGMEHCLGLTCDPVGGLVQIPCIERNAIGATKAIVAAQLAMSGDGAHYVSLDRVIETMRQTGFDMQTKYKETSLGGLAVNVVLC